MNKTTFLVSVKQVLVGLCLGFLLATLPCGGSVGDDVSSFLDSVQEKVCKYMALAVVLYRKSEWLCLMNL